MMYKQKLDKKQYMKPRVKEENKCFALPPICPDCQKFHDPRVRCAEYASNVFRLYDHLRNTVPGYEKRFDFSRVELMEHHKAPPGNQDYTGRITWDDEVGCIVCDAPDPYEEINRQIEGPDGREFDVID